MNPKNEKKSPIHENADANITCDFGDGNISRSRSFLSNTRDTYIHTHIASSIIVRFTIMSNHASLDHDISVPLLHVDQLSEEDGETSLDKQLSQQPSASVLSPDQLPQQDQTYDTPEPSRGGFS